MGSGNAIRVRHYRQAYSDVNGGRKVAVRTLLFGTSLTPDLLRLFGATGCARRGMRKHKMAQKREKYMYMGIPRNFLSSTVRGLLVKTINILERLAVKGIDGHGKTGSDGVGNKDLGAKSGGDKSVVKRVLHSSTYRNWSWNSSRHRKSWPTRRSSRQYRS